MPPPTSQNRAECVGGRSWIDARVFNTYQGVNEGRHIRRREAEN